MSGGTGGGGSGGGGMSVGSTLFLLLAFVGVVTAAGFVHYRRTQDQMRDQVSPLSAQAAVGGEGGSSLISNFVPAVRVCTNAGVLQS